VTALITPKLRAPAARSTVFEFKLYASPTRGPIAPYHPGVIVREFSRPGPNPAKINAPGNPSAPGFGFVTLSSLHLSFCSTGG
jgi:hypothetical protein